MRYKNTKTGAIIDSSCKIAGGDWVPFEKTEQEAIEVENIEVEAEDKNEENSVTVVSEEDSSTIDGVTKNEIMQELDAQGIKYNKNDKKEVLYKLMIGE